MKELIDNSVLGDFTKKMETRLLEKVKLGYTGWQYKKERAYMLGVIEKKMDRISQGTAKEKDYVDVANFVMFIHHQTFER